MRLALGLLSLSFALPLHAQQPGQPLPPVAMPGQIVTSGTGSIKVVPDRATLLIGVESRAKTAAAAGTANAAQQTAVLSALRKLGLTSDQLSTEGYDLQAEQTYEQDKGPRIIGYIARNIVHVELRDIKQVGPAIDAALGAGATNINSLQFTASNVDDARRGALAKAVAQACGDAQILARAAGRYLGPVSEISTLGDNPRPMFAMEAASFQRKAAAPTPIEPGNLDIGTTVYVRWNLAPEGVTGMNTQVTRKCGTP